jgi:pimeloyl-ACP methyl ester carboxylesterase
VRDHALALMDGLLDALGFATAAVVAHSLGGMFALWYAAARPERIASLVAIGEPAAALPGVRIPSVAKIPGATLHEVPGGHGPWLDDPAVCAKLVAGHLAATGFAPAV